MTSVHGELTIDGQTIVLIAGGEQADILRAAKFLQILTPLFSKSDPPGALTVPATWSVCVQLAATFGQFWCPGPHLQAWISEQAASRSGTPEISYTPPSGLTPYPWQLQGAAMIAATGRALITDEPGTGKTITAILGLVERVRPGDPIEDAGGTLTTPNPIVVVCPASVVDAWVEAWQVWAPHVRTIAWRGSKRRELLGSADVYVCSYDVARIDAPVAGTKAMKPLLEMHPAALVVDECHLIKNKDSKRSQAVRRLAKQVNKAHGAVVALSGTPITHHPGDLWPTLEALEPDAYPSSQRWVQRYCQTLPEEYGGDILGLLSSREPEFRLTLLGQHRRVAKADVLSDLPPKVYSVRTVDLPKAWRKVYDDFESQMLAELPDGSELSVMDVMSKFTHLSRLASAAADVSVSEELDPGSGEIKRHVHLDLKAPCWKADALMEILEERRTDSGLDDLAPRCEPVVCFAPSRQLVVLAGEQAAKAGYRVGYIVGGQSATERTGQVSAFQAGDLDLICVTTQAGGVGLTLTAARTVVFLQRPWSLVDAIQAEDRCHRIGSERHDSIEIIDIVARDTIDTRIRTVLRERAGQLADLVQDPRVLSELLGGAAVTKLRAVS